MNHSSSELLSLAASTNIANQIEHRKPSSIFPNVSSNTQFGASSALPNEIRPPASPSNTPPSMGIKTSKASSEPRPNEKGPIPNDWHFLNFKKESDRLRSYQWWPVPYIDPHRLAAAGFYYKYENDMVKCPFCGVEMGEWEEDDDPLTEHYRWSPNCGFLRGLPVGNIPIPIPNTPISSNSVNATIYTAEASHSYNVCGNNTSLEIRPFAIPEIAGLSNGMENQGVLTVQDPEKHGIKQSIGPVYPHYNTYEGHLLSYGSWPRSIKQKPEACLQSYQSLPSSLKQKPEKLSEAGFFYTGQSCSPREEHFQAPAEVMDHRTRNNPANSQPAKTCQSPQTDPFYSTSTFTLPPHVNPSSPIFPDRLNHRNHHSPPPTPSPTKANLESTATFSAVITRVPVNLSDQYLLHKAQSQWNSVVGATRIALANDATPLVLLNFLEEVDCADAIRNGLRIMGKHYVIETIDELAQSNRLTSNTPKFWKKLLQSIKQYSQSAKIAYYRRITRL